MCRTTDFLLPGLQSRDRSILKIKAFFVRFKGLKSCKPLLDSLTLIYLPRINESELIVDGSKVRPDSPAFLTLHRVVNAKTKEGEAIFGSRERVWTNGGVRFEIHLGQKKVLEGIFRKDEEEWKLECECGLESEIIVGGDGAIAEADVCVAVEGHVALGGRVEMVSKKKKNKRRMAFDRLEVIPEEREEADDDSDGGGDLEESYGADCDLMEMDLEGVRWAVDVGLWVMCLGVGYLVSKASARRLRRLRLL